jgi:hypothetical protein
MVRRYYFPWYARQKWARLDFRNKMRSTARLNPGTHQRLNKNFIIFTYSITRIFRIVNPWRLRLHRETFFIFEVFPILVFRGEVSDSRTGKSKSENGSKVPEQFCCQTFTSIFRAIISRASTGPIERTYDTAAERTAEARPIIALSGLLMHSIC